MSSGQCSTVAKNFLKSHNVPHCFGHSRSKKIQYLINKFSETNEEAIIEGAMNIAVVIIQVIVYKN